jgi:hypothetical protein
VGRVFSPGTLGAISSAATQTAVTLCLMLRVVAPATGIPQGAPWPD